MIKYIIYVAVWALLVKNVLYVIILASWPLDRIEWRVKLRACVVKTLLWPPNIITVGPAVMCVICSDIRVIDDPAGGEA